MSTSHDRLLAPILAPNDVVTLQKSGLVSPALSDGTRRIHKRRLNRSSNEEEQHLPLTPISIASNSDFFASIPEYLVSFATKHLGYNLETATRIWEYWTNWPPGKPKRESDDIYHGVPFIEVAEGYIDNCLDTCEDDDARWFHCMDLYGISGELQEAIMDPKFRNIRLTQTCKFWVQDTFQLRYRGLQAVQEASHERERDMANRREASQPEQSQSVCSGQQSISDSPRIVPWLSHETALSHAATSASTNAPVHTTLYKGIDQARVNSLFDHNSNVDFGCLTSAPCSDFSPRQADIYFVVDREVAEYYACYAKRRGMCSAVVIVQVTIPNSVFESLSAPDLQLVYWPSAEWKSLVFNCRLGKKVPFDLRKYRLAKLVIGTICGKPTVVLSNMQSPDEIVEQMVFKTKDGRNAVQYVFKGDEGETLLEESSSVAVFPLTRRELEYWHETV